MAKKKNIVYMCTECGGESAKWSGQCPFCGEWNTMVEMKAQEIDESDKRRRSAAEPGKRASANRLRQVEADTHQDRLDTGIGELNRVLGGGIVPGSLTLISGEPGIGKSTIIMQAAVNIAKKYGKILYVSGEESEEQLKLRADRICPDLNDDFYTLAETNIENVAAVTEEMEPKFLIIDSIQTMYSQAIDSAPGSVSQVRECGNEFMRIGKVRNIPIFIVAHVTKSGELAGPKTVEHLVDCVLNFVGERNQDLRILRSFKNRFGTTSEIGAFEMGEHGLAEIKDLSKRFLEDMEDGAQGSMVTAVYEGTRPLLLEVQALSAPSGVGFARRTAIGFDNQRLNMILAVLERQAGLSLQEQDVYVNVVGGFRPDGTSTDLAVALAIHSTYRGISCRKDTLALGEIGLTGDLRRIQYAERIIKEAARMGFRRVILPKSQARRLGDLKAAGAISGTESGVSLLGVKNISEAIAAYQK
ncbi:MAG: DNA repair protein RadA [Eubacteriaceae bacterium]|jgi:DNA repair protein RadA/Sms|nr:DNA repair protein RadA [Eubacteriaceae bacterium]